MPSAKERSRDPAERRGPFSGGGNWEGTEIGLGLFQDGRRVSPALRTVYEQSCTLPPFSWGQLICAHPPLRLLFLIWTMASRLNLSFQAEDRLL